MTKRKFHCKNTFLWSFLQNIPEKSVPSLFIVKVLSGGGWPEVFAEVVSGGGQQEVFVDVFLPMHL
jgi:hypothetical protein